MPSRQPDVVFDGEAEERSGDVDVASLAVGERDPPGDHRSVGHTSTGRSDVPDVGTGAHRFGWQLEQAGAIVTVSAVQEAVSHAEGVPSSASKWTLSSRSRSRMSS